MSAVSLISFVVCAGLIVSCFRKEADVLSPGRLFAFLWSLAIGLADLKFSSLQSEWSVIGWLYLLIGLGAFLLGTFIVYVLNSTQGLVPVTTIRTRIREQRFNEGALFGMTLLLFVLYLVSFGASYVIKGFVPLLSSRPAQMRTQFSVFAFGLIIHAAPVIMFLVVEYFLLAKRRRLRKSVLIAVFVITAGSYFLLLQRFDYLIWAAVSFVFLYYGSAYVRFGTAFVTLAPFVGVFYWVSSLRLAGAIKNYLYLSSKMRFSVDYAFLTEPYMYIVTNLENFVRASQRLEQHTFGYYSFNFIASLTGLKHWIEDYFALNDTPFINSGYNTYSLLWTYYRDFGLIGLTLFPLLEGAVIAWLYYSMRKMPTILTVSTYGLAVFVILISFFHNALGMLQFVFVGVVVYYINRRAVAVDQPAGTVPGLNFGA